MERARQLPADAQATLAKAFQLAVDAELARRRGEPGEPSPEGAATAARIATLARFLGWTVDNPGDVDAASVEANRLALKRALEALQGVDGSKLVFASARVRETMDREGAGLHALPAVLVELEGYDPSFRFERSRPVPASVKDTFERFDPRGGHGFGPDRLTAELVVWLGAFGEDARPTHADAIARVVERIRRARKHRQTKK